MREFYYFNVFKNINEEKDIEEYITDTRFILTILYDDVEKTLTLGKIKYFVYDCKKDSCKEYNDNINKTINVSNCYKMLDRYYLYSPYCKSMLNQIINNYRMMGYIKGLDKYTMYDCYFYRNDEFKKVNFSPNNISLFVSDLKKNKIENINGLTNEEIETKFESLGYYIDLEINKSMMRKHILNKNNLEDKEDEIMNSINQL